MMPDLVMIPQPVKVPVAKSAAPAQSAKAAMQKAVSGNETSVQAAQTATNPTAKPAADKSKAGDQPTPFLAVLMAQMVTPVEQAAPEVVATPQVQTQTTSQTDASASQAEASATQVNPLAMAVSAQNTQTLATQAVTTDSATPVAATVVENVTVSPADVAAVVTTQDTQTTETTPAVTPVSKPLVEKPDSDNQQPQKEKTNPVPAAAQTPATPSLRNKPVVEVDDSQTQDETPAQPVNTNATTTQKIPTPTVPNKPALAEALVERATARVESKQQPNTGKSTQTNEVPAARVANTNSQAMFNNPNIIAANAAHAATAAVTIPQDTTTTAASVLPTTTDAAATAKPLTTQLVDGIRNVATSVSGSDKTLTLSLNPPELGRVLVKMQEDSGSITAVLRVENPVTRADIEQSVTSIVRSLEQAGIQVKRLDVLPSDPIPQEGLSRQYDFQQGMPNQQRDSQQTGQTGQAGSNGSVRTESWQDIQQPVMATSQQSTGSDSGLNFYL